MKPKLPAALGLFRVYSLPQKKRKLLKFAANATISATEATLSPNQSTQSFFR